MADPNIYQQPQMPDQGDPAQARLVAERLEREDQDRQYHQMIREASKMEHKDRELKEVLRVEALAEQKTKDRIAKRREELRLKFSQEPAESDGVMTCAFRVPNGARIVRRFDKAETLQDLCDFIWTKDDIGFEEDSQEFDLVNGQRKVFENLGLTLEAQFGKSKKELFIVNAK
jgi:hypothetical protein